MNENGYRMMRRQKIIAVVNRTNHEIEATDDGIPVVLPPGYRKLPDGNIVGAGPHGQPVAVYLPLATAQRAMDQNKLRGSVNPDDFLDCVFLLGRVGIDDISYVEDNTNPDEELIDRQGLPNAKLMDSRPPGRRRSRRDKNSGVLMSRSGLSDVAVHINEIGRSLPPETASANRPFEAPDL